MCEAKVMMAKLDTATKKVVLRLSSKGWSAAQIASELKEEHATIVSRQAIN